METNFNFKSSVCTTREHSERLLALGLKKETADMHWRLQPYYNDEGFDCGLEWSCNMGTFLQDDAHELFLDYIPAWSLGRLIKDLMPQSIGHLELAVGSDYAGYYEDRCESESGMWWEYSSETSDMFDNIISTIEWLIKKRYFPKEYLV